MRVWTVFRIVRLSAPVSRQASAVAPVSLRLSLPAGARRAPSTLTDRRWLRPAGATYLIPAGDDFYSRRICAGVVLLARPPALHVKRWKTDVALLTLTQEVTMKWNL